MMASGHSARHFSAIEILFYLPSIWFLSFEGSRVHSSSYNEDTAKEFVMSEEDRSETTTLPSTIPAEDLPLDLYDIGYMGTWERFCDPEEIKKDFTNYPYYHELMRIRNTICDLRRQNRINHDALPAFALYKYCDSMRSRVDSILGELVSKFSQNDEAKKMELLDEGPLLNCTDCYEVASKMFKRKCMGKMNPYFDMFQPLLGRICIMEWTTTEEVLRHIRDACKDKLISDDIDWTPILGSIKYRLGGNSKPNTTVTPTRPSVDLDRFRVE